jgi:hypothetical protein
MSGERLATSPRKTSHASKPEEQGFKVRHCAVALQKKKKINKKEERMLYASRIAGY